MTRTKVFSKDYLVNELDLPWGNTIFDRIVDTTRWSIIHEIVRFETILNFSLLSIHSRHHGVV